MLTESCIGCGADVPLSGAVHILVNPKGDRDVTDGYLCRSCYEEHVEPLLPEESGDEDDERDDSSDESADDATGGADGPAETDDRDDRPLEEA